MEETVLIDDIDYLKQAANLYSQLKTKQDRE
jgi:hypothetical protein